MSLRERYVQWRHDRGYAHAMRLLRSGTPWLALILEHSRKPSPFNRGALLAAGHWCEHRARAPAAAPRREPVHDLALSISDWSAA